MEKTIELIEIKKAADDLVSSIDSSLALLEGALKWSFWDLIGGDFISSYFKRKKIKEVNDQISRTVRLIETLNMKLEELHMDLPSEISNTLSDKFLDIWLDNIFTDIRVKKELEERRYELLILREKVVDLRDKLSIAI